MKYCKNCNSATEESSLFCSSCGGSEFNEAAQAQQPAQPENPMGQMPYNPDPSLVQKPKKSVLSKVVIGVIIAAVCAFLVFAIVKIANTTPYTKGEVSDGAYVNEWANLKFDLGEDWVVGSSDEHKTVESEGVECGLVAESDYAYVTLAFCEGWGGSTAKEYIEEWDPERAITDELDPTYTALAVGGDTEKVIAGEKYTVRRYEATWTEDGILYAQTRYECIRIEGTYAIHLTVIVLEADMFDDVADNFKAVKAD